MQAFCRSMKNYKSISILLALVLCVNIFNGLKEPSFKIKVRESDELIFWYSYDAYKTQRIDVYFVKNSETTNMELMANYTLGPVIDFKKLNIFDLSAFFLKQSDELSLVIDDNTKGICISFKNGDRFSLCESDVFDLNVDNYELIQTVEYNDSGITILKMKSLVDKNIIEIVLKIS